MRDISEQFIPFHQIRASVLYYWLQHNDLRFVQHKAGHKYVSSTERYKDQQLDELFSRMNGNKAIIRIARKLLNRIRYVLINKQEYVLALAA